MYINHVKREQLRNNSVSLGPGWCIFEKMGGDICMINLCPKCSTVCVSVSLLGIIFSVKNIF